MKIRLSKPSSSKKYLCEDKFAKQGELFDIFLSEYQEDIIKIIGKYRHFNHKLSLEEIASEANTLIIKGKNKIIEKLGDEFDQNNFKKMCFAYVKNAITWTQWAELSSKEQKHIEDSIYETDEGPMTSFDIAVQKEGIDNFFEAFEDEHILKKFLHVLTKYYYLLSESESKILNLMCMGWNQEQIAEELEVTRQAVSFAYISMKEKLQSQFNFKEINADRSFEGNKAINAFFNKEA